MSIAFALGEVAGTGLMLTVIPAWAGGLFERYRPSTLRICLGVAISGLLALGGSTYGGSPAWLAGACFATTLILAYVSMRKKREPEGACTH